MSEILILASITLLAAISPGPDMIVVVKNAIRSLKSWIMTSIGVGAAIFIHVAYCIAWVGIIISQSILLFSIIKILGAIYLIFLAYQLFRSKCQETEMIQPESVGTSVKWSLYEGFITNVLNPKATLFFLSVFTQVIAPDTPIITQVLYGAMMASIVGVWFVILSLGINFPFVKKNIAGVQYYLNRLMWWILLFLGVKILLSHK